MADDEDLSLADEVSEGDDPAPCYIEGCGVTGMIVIGAAAELVEYCPEHAALLALQLLELPMVQQELQRQGKLALVLDEAQVGHLRLITRTHGTLPAVAREYRDTLHTTLAEHVQTSRKVRRPTP